MDVAFPRAAFDIIANMLVLSIMMLSWSLVSYRDERGRFPRAALVTGALVLQAACIGTIWLHEGKYALSTVLLAVAVAVVVGLIIVAIRRDPISARFKK